MTVTDSLLPSQIESRVQSLLIEPLQTTLGAVASLGPINIDGGKVNLSIQFKLPCDAWVESLSAQIWAAIKDLPGVDEVALDTRWAVEAGPVMDRAAAIANVKNIIAVASGKGGVGKSTTAVNLALALKAEGASVGILDADIYGPSIPAMLGVGSKRPEVIDQKAMVPLVGHGVHSISMGYLVTEQTPVVWRGPMASGALQQLLMQTAWPELDYLIIDMPPGTGDIQLTLSQKVPVTGAVVVTTPQDIALLDAQKGIEMFRKVNVPVLGVVENMATHICSSCGHEEHIFGEGGGQRIADTYQTPLLGALPLSLPIRQQADSGCPTVAENADSAESMLYRQIARKVAVALIAQAQQASVPSIEITDD